MPIKNWKKHEKAIYEYVESCKANVRGSKGYSKLKKRKNLLRNAIDMVSTDNSFRAGLYLPLTRMRSRTSRAILRENFRGDPIISVHPVGNTTVEGAKYVQDMVEQNLRETEFRSRTHERVIGYGADYGTAVIYSNFQEMQVMQAETSFDPMTGYERAVRNVEKRNVWNKCIDLLDYGQDPRCVDPSESSYQFHIDNKPLAAMMAELKKPNSRYDKENLNKYVKQCKKQVNEDSEQSEVVDYDRYNMNDFCFFYGKLPIKGNERDQTEYFVVTGGEWTLRVDAFPIDYNLRPYSICRIDPKLTEWWANGTPDLGVAANDFLNIIWNTTAENAMNALQQYVFYDRLAFPEFDPADINQRRRNGGFIGLNTTNKNINQLLYVHQGQDISLNSTNNLTRELKEWDQRTAPSLDMQRAQQEGGLANKTATAANMIARQGNMQQNDMLMPFADGYRHMARVNVTLLQQYMGSEIAIYNKAANRTYLIEKQQILGQYDYVPHTSLTKNKELELLRLSNVMNMLLNAKATQDPAMGTIKLHGIVKELIRMAELPGEDTEYYDEQAANEQMVQQAQMQALPQPNQMTGV